MLSFSIFFYDGLLRIIQEPLSICNILYNNLYDYYASFIIRLYLIGKYINIIEFFGNMYIIKT